ncbi:Bug family tripartite tricarboxylate transporter substrate binding protein [Enterovirga aerilata]|uniref:Tripartite tricarboxylate transporter substrate binding protein n=1 Tax=Enterovirga aerilata TaxID=2730920 RepID=A0A849I9X8_9HYPH|nr:tripartite tricarboxylate transporter substrate binding protein [Enterovirga sp. DB1703]NNM74111.1 tripartite tricarboxylate transporter substrate binding protein [Enterovirga sp. DB1703]
MIPFGLRKTTVALLAAAAVLAGAGTGRAGEYPERLVRIIVPFGAGGGVDALARAVAQELTTALGQSVIVENRGGAGGNVGIAAVARSEPDGYTLLVTSNAVVTNPALYNPAPFDPIKDLAPVTELGTTPDLIVVPAASPLKDLAQVVRESKEKPGKFTYGSGARGASPHLMVERLQKAAGIRMVHVPYSGAGPNIQALLANTTDMSTSSYSSVKGQVDAGLIRPLFHAGPARLPDLPNVPTLKELGYDIVSETFIAMFAPAGTDTKIVERLSKAVLAALEKPSVRDAIEKTGVVITASGPEALRERVVREVPIWAETVAETGLRQP